MRHLDDGQIAELVDGAGAADVAAALAAHLAACAACRERLDEARQVAERARVILATAVPGPSAAVPVPDFAEVLHRAGRARRRWSVLGLRSLAWAATLVLAGGLGWFARDRLRPAPVTPPRAPAAAEMAAATTPSEADVTRPLDSIAPAAEAGGRGASSAAGRPAVHRQESTATRLARSRAPANALADRRDEAAAAKGVAENPLPPARSDEAGRLAIRQPAPAPAEQAPMGAAELRVQAPPAPGESRIVVSREVIERVLGGRPASVEGLGIDAYYQLAAQPDVIHAEQRLPGGAVLELEQRRAVPLPAPGALARERDMARSFEAAPAAQAPTGRVAPADSVVMSTDTVDVAGLRVVVRAPVPPDSLRALVRRIRR